MTIFNQNERSTNILRNSYISTCTHFFIEFIGFIYRTIFVRVLSTNYLGISGLFSNILGVLSLAELGIGTAITYRFYKPISENDVEKVGQLVNYFRTVYMYIAGVVLLLGTAVFPFLNFLIKDTSEVPGDVNLKIVYLLYLFNTVTSYTYYYKFTILNADQKQYIYSLIYAGIETCRYTLQIITLVILRDFTITLASGIVFTFASKIVTSNLSTKQYKPVFDIKTKLPENEKKQILHDTKALLLHRIGDVVLNSTDNLVLSKYVGLAVTGMYSNYWLIIRAVQVALNKLFGSFVGSLGNAYASVSKTENYKIFCRLQWICLCGVGLCAVELMLCINDFMRLWLGQNELLFSMPTVICLALEFWMLNSKIISNAYISASGCFVYDRYRPLIEGAVNLVVSIVLAEQIGVVGVFIGTIISDCVTTFWRLPKILFSKAFQRPVLLYWKPYMKWLAISAAYGAISLYIKSIWNVPTGWVTLILQATLVGCGYVLLVVMLYWKSDELCFLKNFVRKKIKILLKY